MFKKAKKFHTVIIPMESKQDKIVGHNRPTKYCRTMGNFIQYGTSPEVRRERGKNKKIMIEKLLSV